MSWYNVIFIAGELKGFIVDDFEVPVKHKTEENADDAMKGHFLESVHLAVEIEDL